MNSEQQQSLPLHVRVLGTFSVFVGNRRVSEGAWKLRKAKAILKLLAIANDHRLPRDVALDTLWPDLDPQAATNNLHKALLVARRALEPDSSGAGSYIQFRNDTLSLEADGGFNVDAVRFEKLAADASATGLLETYEAAIATYQGQLLPDDPYEDWALDRRQDLQKRFQDLLTEYANLMESEGRIDEAIAATQRIVSLEPGFEAAHARLMELFTRSGDRHRAIRQYQSLEQTLKADFGIEPQPETRELYDSIVGGRHALASTGRRQQAAVSHAPTAPKSDSTANDTFMFRAFTPVGGVFAGRDRELETVRPAVDALADGTGSAVLISGPAGSGKSRLSLEIAARASSAGAAVMRGGSYELERNVPYGPFSEAFDRFLDEISPQSRRTLVDSAPVDVYPLIPRTAQELGLRQTVVESHDRDYLFAAVESLLRSLATNAPIVLVLDDLHSADDATLELFHFLARKTSELPLLMIATFRSEGEAVSRQLSRVLATMSRIGDAQRIQLSPLARDAVGEVVAGLLGQDVHPDLFEAVYAASEGNPLFAEETVRTMQESGAIEQQAHGAWQAVASLERVPDAISHLLNDRYERLSPEGRSLLTVAAVIGSESTYPVMRAASGLDEDRVLDALDELLSRHLMIESGDAYRFGHNMHRAVALEGLSRARKRSIHTSVSQALLNSGGNSTDERAEFLAFHLLNSDEPSKAIPYLMQAGRHAAAVFANEQALEHLTNARKLLADSDGEDNASQMGTVLESMGDVEARIGNADTSLDLFKEAIKAFSPTDPESGVRVQGKAALAAINAERVDEGGELLQSVLANISPDMPEASVTSTYLLLAQIEWHSASHNGALEAAEKALEAALSSGDQTEAARAYEALALSCHSLGDWQKGIEYELSRAETNVPGFDTDTVFDGHL